MLSQQTKTIKENITKITGVKVNAKYIATGSLKGCFHVYSQDKSVRFWGNEKVINALNNAGYRDFDNKEFTNTSGNGGDFSILVTG